MGRGVDVTAGNLIKKTTRGSLFEDQYVNRNQ